MPHYFRTDGICAFCGVAEWKATPGAECPLRRDDSLPLPEYADDETDTPLMLPVDERLDAERIETEFDAWDDLGNPVG